MTVQAIEIDGRRASWRRDGGELIVTPRDGLRNGANFTVEVKYRGVPETLEDGSGFIHTDDGALIIGEPHVAATWFPVNDHPSDKAAYTTKMTVPAGLEAVGNGELEGRSTKHGWTTWTWDADEPMASYLVTASVGQFDLRAYKHKGIKIWDAFDPDLWDPTGTARTGTQFAISQVSQPSYKRLARTISVPAGGANMSFWIKRDTEANWDFVFVEAHAAGSPIWTTLQDQNGHTSEDTGFVCPFWFGLHPFLENYQSDDGAGGCTPAGDTGHWWAVSGDSGGGYEQWKVDLGAYAGSNVEVSISYASDDLVQLSGAFVDDIVVSTGEGSTSFENDGNTFDGWTVPGAPAGSAANPNDWIVGTEANTPPPIGTVVDASFARQGEILDFEKDLFGDYPFSAAGGIVDDLSTIGFALENQTRPIYAKAFFTDTESGDSVIVHELAHQWYGDSLAVAKWSEIWLNEGFATYAEWLWSEHDGLATAQEIFDNFYFGIPADNPFWQVVIGNPGADLIFDISVYWRGGMTLHQLRLEVGDRDFFKILRTWAQTREGDNVKISEFIKLAERISHEDLDDLFDAWLFTPGRPALPAAAIAKTSSMKAHRQAGSLSASVLKARLEGKQK